MILFNGSTGGLGRYFRAALEQGHPQGVALQSRMEDQAGLQQELRVLRPHGPVTLVQMAARVPVAACQADPEGTWQVNVRHTCETVVTVVRWAQAQGLATRVVYVSSGHVYAAGCPGQKAREGDPTAPRSVYAQTKRAAEEAVSALAREQGFSARVVRVFGLVAPAQPPSYVLPGLIRRVREHRLEAVPGLDYVRDYLDSRDVCAGLVSLCASPPPTGSADIVNLCSGEPTPLRTLLERVVYSLRPHDAARLLAGVGAAPGRPDDIPWIVGDACRFREITGRNPRNIPLEETVREACAMG